jgi:protein phosphatase
MNVKRELMRLNTRYTILLLLLTVAFDGAVSQDTIPVPRFGHTFTSVGTSLYLYGGYSSGDSAGYLSDLQRYDPSDNTWEVVQSFTGQPPGRATHAAAVCQEWSLPNVFLGIVCGTGASGELNDLWGYYPDDQTWAEMPQNGLELPSPRTDHIAICVDSELFIYGGRGCCGTGVRSDLWAYDLEADVWEEREEYEPRYGHSVAVHGDNVYVYGGMGIELYDNIIMYDPENDGWETVEPEGQVPPARRLHVSAYNGSKMWIIGGLGEDGALSDTWEYDFAANTWLQKADAPLLSRAAAALDVHNPNQFFLFGGLDAVLNPTNELWRYDADSDEWEELEPVGTWPAPLAAYYELRARPNPFRTHTSFLTEPRFPMPSQAILIHDVRGSLVTTLQGPQNVTGSCNVSWDGTDRFGRVVAPGTYLVKTSENEVRRIVKLP